MIAELEGLVAREKAQRAEAERAQAEAAAQERRNDRLRMVLPHCRRGMPMETEEFVMIPGMLPQLIALHFFPVQSTLG